MILRLFPAFLIWVAWCALLVLAYGDSKAAGDAVLLGVFAVTAIWGAGVHAAARAPLGIGMSLGLAAVLALVLGFVHVPLLEQAHDRAGASGTFNHFLNIYWPLIVVPSMLSGCLGVLVAAFATRRAS